MNRRQLLFVILLNAFISLVIAVVVVWVAESRRPDLEELAAQYTPPPPVLVMPTPGTPAAGGEPVAQPAPDGQASPTPVFVPTATPTPAQAEVYVVQAGDSLFAIALRYNVTVDALMAANNLTNPDFVFSGQRLVIPSGSSSPGAGSGSAPPPVAASASLQLRADQPGDLNAEGVLIINDGNSPVNLQGWYLTGEVSDPVYVFQDLPLFPGGSVRLHSRAGTDDSLNLYWGRSASVWRSGATIRLFNASGSQVATVGVP